jgi:hypothetical protein
MALPPAAAAFAKQLAKCILTWVYQQAKAILDALRAFIEKIIALIDLQITALRAFIASIDPANIFNKFIWDNLVKLYEAAKNALLSGLPGPDPKICPQFYQFLTDPALALLEATMAVLESYRDKYLKFLSFTGFLNRLLSYWEGSKAMLRGFLDILDDALAQALLVEADNYIAP